MQLSSKNAAPKKAQVFGFAADLNFSLQDLGDQGFSRTILTSPIAVSLGRWAVGGFSYFFWAWNTTFRKSQCILHFESFWWWFTMWKSHNWGFCPTWEVGQSQSPSSEPNCPRNWRCSGESFHLNVFLRRFSWLSLLWILPQKPHQKI